MPSPFPGMDPYLEEPSQWPGVHQRLITYIADAMQPCVRPRYHVLIGERVYIAEPPQRYDPDVTLVQYPAQRAPADSRVAVAEPDGPTAMGSYLDEAQRQPFIAIVHASTGVVVAIIEVLSPSNKIGAGREEYRREQAQILSSGTHLIGIDSLRAGAHTVACPQERLPIPSHDLVCINRAVEGWAVSCILLQRRLQWPVSAMCEALQVSRSELSADVQRHATTHVGADTVLLLVRVKAMAAETRYSYGSRRMAKQLHADS